MLYKYLHVEKNKYEIIVNAFVFRKNKKNPPPTLLFFGLDCFFFLTPLFFASFFVSLLHFHPLHGLSTFVTYTDSYQSLYLLRLKLRKIGVPSQYEYKYWYQTNKSGSMVVDWSMYAMLPIPKPLISLPRNLKAV